VSATKTRKENLAEKNKRQKHKPGLQKKLLTHLLLASTALSHGGSPDVGAIGALVKLLMGRSIA
jgi:hypothetical protein